MRLALPLGTSYEACCIAVSSLASQRWHLYLPLAFSEMTPALLQNLPKQCYLESSRENLFWSLGIAAIASQLGNLYCALSLVLRMPLKRE